MSLKGINSFLYKPSIKKNSLLKAIFFARFIRMNPLNIHGITYAYQICSLCDMTAKNDVQANNRIIAVLMYLYVKCIIVSKEQGISLLNMLQVLMKPHRLEQLQLHLIHSIPQI